ncbi:pyoverdine/dityrosine biosynthesis family protein [Penicillium waksmanii]|uniref:pyoverdine/dityrosine biosynthesis family protein n=1 Tax=Penicillium waksmanii TaxID=69791 RepID=UPI002547DA06|nr:pyoverdine/dityrosine biosynthesis family protein [Penicillium waksmanii]KAJ5988138.1 pyoverdine/dityrosine biosynthesis family protein [Penicillium waksmanii]
MADCIYDRLVAIYSRTHQGDLIQCFGGDVHSVHSIWFLIEQQLNPQEFNSYHSLSNTATDGLSSPSQLVNIHELRLPHPSTIVGIALRPGSTGLSISYFEEFFCYLLLQQIARLSIVLMGNQAIADVSIAQQVVDLCNDELLIHPSNSQWEAVGRDYFLQKICFFTSRELTIEMCLPAFPCKSSNPDKVAGALPDRGEELALRRLYSVSRKIKSIYEPGVRICIISDGHVFSDCIGVDDDKVDEYGLRLHELNESIALQEGQPGVVSFQSLRDIFHSTPKSVLGETGACQIELPILEHFLGTSIANETEFCRQALALACQPNRSSLRTLIKGQDPAIVALYRGFSRFMLEDLALHPRSQSTSRSQRKKVAEKISFEMLLRNQAYSNLVELFFPVHVRLSIHAHVNSGPKFGISLFDRSKTRVIDNLNDLSSIAKPSHDLLHIPTPWHNCVFQVSGSDFTYITKSKVIHDARMSGLIRGHWVRQDRDSASGGYFHVDAPERTETSQITAVSTSKSPIVSSVPARAIPATEDMAINTKRTKLGVPILMAPTPMLQEEWVWHPELRVEIY